MEKLPLSSAKVSTGMASLRVARTYAGTGSPAAVRIWPDTGMPPGKVMRPM